MKELSEEEFKKLGNPSIDLEEEKEEQNSFLLDSYNNLLDILKKYVDLREEYYPLLSLWIIGTYIHLDFPSYPFLFFNAMKGSGKTRLLKLVTYLSKDGELLNSLSEAVLFRTKGTLGIDEFEGLNRKGGEGLRELLNSAYKKGCKVKRMKKKKTMEGEEQVVEEFDVYRPILMANIWGMESVLGDRCINLILEKSSKNKITKKMELFEHDFLIQKTKELLIKCRLCCVVCPQNIYMEWNDYIDTNDIYTLTTQNNTNNTSTITTLTTPNHINYTNPLFKEIDQSGINGRHLELAMPLLIIAHSISQEIFQSVLETLKGIMEDKIQADFSDSWDVSLIDYVSQETSNNFKSLTDITNEFRQFIQGDEEINVKWVGRALKRLNLILQKRRLGRGREVILNIQKAHEKIRMFK